VQSAMIPTALACSCDDAFERWALNGASLFTKLQLILCSAFCRRCCRVHGMESGLWVPRWNFHLLGGVTNMHTHGLVVQWRAGGGKCVVVAVSITKLSQRLYQA
jgi:hypothetical protein